MLHATQHPEMTHRHVATLKQVRPTLWRVLRTDGSMAGYIEAGSSEFGRYEARRLIASTRQVIGIGDFSTIDDALSCFS